MIPTSGAHSVERPRMKLKGLLQDMRFTSATSV